MQSVSDNVVHKRLLEKPRFELAVKGVFRLIRIVKIILDHTVELGGLVTWLGAGVGLVINRLRVRFPAVHCWVTTWMGDPLWADKLSRYVTGYLGQLSLPSLRGR